MMKNDNTANGGTKINSRKLNGWRRIVTLCLAGIVLNFVLSNAVNALGLPLYLDNVGTMLCAVLGGWLPGVIVGLTNNVINCITDPSSIYYGFISTLIATVTLFFFEKGKLKKLMHAIVGGALVTCVCYACYYAGIGDSLNHMIVGAVIPLVPGVAFTNGIRDIGNEDYIAGTVRLLDAMLVFFGIAAGVGGMMMILRGLFGGGML